MNKLSKRLEVVASYINDNSKNKVYVKEVCFNGNTNQQKGSLRQNSLS